MRDSPLSKLWREVDERVTPPYRVVYPSQPGLKLRLSRARARQDEYPWGFQLEVLTMKLINKGAIASANTREARGAFCAESAYARRPENAVHVGARLISYGVARKGWRKDVPAHGRYCT